MDAKRASLGHMTMATAAADELRRRIMVGEFAEGFQLKQDALATEFGISRIPLREALVQLESEGLVEILPHKGAIVSKLSGDELIELFELRSLLEPMLLKLSIPKLTAQDFEELDRILAEFAKELQGRKTERWGDLNTRFHEILLSRADRPKTHGIVTSLLRQTDRYTRLHLSLSAGISDRAAEEHVELVRLCRKHEMRNAAALLKRHILQGGEELKAFIQKKTSS
ncbi:GntR family transcriptional regulator [Paraburkholderia sp. EG285A]|uniref:GntR family transcriptional regulator n=1 Tax=Paraburkholderia sp. EG285A TaxID=3237009 RepID=UPI0034D32FC0